MQTVNKQEKKATISGRLYFDRNDGLG